MEDINKIAQYIYFQQVEQISEAVLQVLSRLPSHDKMPIIALGSGKYLAIEVAHRLGMEVHHPGSFGNEKASVENNPEIKLKGDSKLPQSITRSR